MYRSYVFALVVVASTALAQNDEWNSFPPAPTQPAQQPPPTKPAPAPQPPPRQVEPPKPAPAPMVPPRQTQAAPPQATPAPAATASTADAGADLDGTVIVSQKERYEAGTEPHSPSTWGRPWDDAENARVSVGQAGIGNLFQPSARLGRKGVVRVSLLGEYLNQSNFPVIGAQDIRSAVTFAASFQPFEWGEVFVAYGATANSNNRTSPNLIQALGDLQLGIKASHQWAPGFWAGVDLRLLTFSGVGNQGIDRFAVGFRPTLLATYDFRTLTHSFPVLLTAGIGATIDSTAGLVTNQTLNASEEYALNVNRYHRLNFHAAAEVPFPIVTPVIEYALAAPLGVPNGELTGPDGRFVTATSAMNQTLGVGLKLTPIKDLTITPGFNFGLARSVGLGVPATPPWNFFVSAAFAIDPWQRGETRFVETVRERKVEIAKVPPAKLEGTITDAATNQPIRDVVVNLAGLKPAATNEAGQYESLPIAASSVKLTIARDGYKPVTRDVTIDPARPTRLDLALESEVKKAKFEVSTTSNKKPVKADISFKGPEAAKGQTPEGNAPAEFELKAGTYTVTATADGYLSQTREVQVQPGGKLVVGFELVAAPKKSLVIFKGDKIEILQQVHFASGKATILPDSFNLLQQVVDVVIKNDLKRVRVEGHTDNRGVKAANQQLSEDRAKAVKDYLVAQGIDAQRLESAGYGDSKPVAPNLTARGRELNRRVEFIVLEK